MRLACAPGVVSMPTFRSPVAVAFPIKFPANSQMRCEKIVNNKLKKHAHLHARASPLGVDHVSKQTIMKQPWKAKEKKRTEFSFCGLRSLSSQSKPIFFPFPNNLLVGYSYSCSSSSKGGIVERIEKGQRSTGDWRCNQHTRSDYVWIIVVKDESAIFSWSCSKEALKEKKPGN